VVSKRRASFSGRRHDGPASQFSIGNFQLTISNSPSPDRILGIDPGLNITGYGVLEVGDARRLRLCEAGIVTERTHNLLHLLDRCMPIEPLWEGLRTPLNVLSAYAVAFRYPGESADRTTARDAIQICKTVRETVRQSLELEMP
jgi:hypothetical protein